MTEQEITKLPWVRVGGSCNWPTVGGSYVCIVSFGFNGKRTKREVGVHVLSGNLDRDRFFILGNPANLGELHYWINVKDLPMPTETEEFK